jgi:type IV pilus assembly protein PilC
MHRKQLNSGYISVFCLELSLFLDAGIPLSDGLHLLADDNHDQTSRSIILEIAAIVDQQKPLSDALCQSGLFPNYMVQMVLLGEKTGQLSSMLQSLSTYYDRQQRLLLAIKNTLTYPAILLAMMIAVVIILITIVLPIFNDVFHQLGTQMPAFTLLLMRLGEGLRAASLFFAILAALMLIFALLLLLLPKFRYRCSRLWRDLRKEKGLAAKISLSRLSNALALTINAGLNLDDSFKMAASLAANSTVAEKKYAECAQLLDQGMALAEALRRTGIFPPVYSRMLMLGAKSGATDMVLAEIANRTEAAVNNDIERILNRIEPILVISSSLLVGMILLSVMVPLMNIMSSLG